MRDWKERFFLAEHKHLLSKFSAEGGIKLKENKKIQNKIYIRYTCMLDVALEHLKLNSKRT